MAAVYICSLFTGSGSHIIIIHLTDDLCVYMVYCTGSGSDTVIIPPLTDDSCAYMFSFYMEWFSYCYNSSH